jgi:hypothetical protein
MYRVVLGFLYVLKTRHQSFNLIGSKNLGGSLSKDGQEAFRAYFVGNAMTANVTTQVSTTVQTVIQQGLCNAPTHLLFRRRKR